MATPALQVFQYAVLIDASGARHVFGSMVDPANLSADLVGEVERQVYSLNASAVALAYNPSTSPAEDFSFFWVKADTDDCYIELTTDVNSGVGTERQTYKLHKNLAFVLGSDTSYANYTSPFAGGTLDVVDRIYVYNSGSDTANVEVVVAR